MLPPCPGATRASFDARSGTGTENAGVGIMSGGTNSKFVSRLVALLFMGLALAGCFAMVSSSERSLFADVGSGEMAR